jgi:hypothetical protein
MSRLAEILGGIDPKAGAKLATLERMYEGMDPTDLDGGHRPLTQAEAKRQRANALTIEQQLLMRAIEHGTYRATQDITVNGVPAFRRGHAVPVSAVEREGYDDLGLVEEVADPEYRRRTYTVEDALNPPTDGVEDLEPGEPEPDDEADGDGLGEPEGVEPETLADDMADDESPDEGPDDGPQDEAASPAKPRRPRKAADHG